MSAHASILAPADIFEIASKISKHKSCRYICLLLGSLIGVFYLSDAQDIPTYQEIARFSQFPVDDIAWHPDGTVLAIKQGDAIILYTDTFEVIETFPILSPTIAAYGDEIGWSPGGSQIAVWGSLHRVAEVVERMILESWNNRPVEGEVPNE